MICLGTPQMAPSSLQSEAAQLHVVSWFREYFLRKYPTGVVISELEFMGRTTSATEAPRRCGRSAGPGSIRCSTRWRTTSGAGARIETTESVTCSASPMME